MLAHKVSDQLFPAHAGMNRDHTVKRKKIGAVPRTRGDEPINEPS